ncbi:MAG TPA: hypothetical protein GX710_03735 [Clostridiales bacterium]|nr:hypothetical protein [Clostridiales bacterium]
MDISIAEKYINNNMIEGLVIYCESLSPNEYIALIEWLIHKMVDCKVPEESNERNTIALVLCDLKCNEAVPQIIELLKKESESPYIGTLVYVLQDLECVDYIEQIFHLLYMGNFEVRKNMFSLLEENKGKISPDIYNSMKQKLDKAIEDYKGILLGLYIAKDEIFYD